MSERGGVALAHAAAICDGLAAAGIRHLVFCPGSRSAPAALAAMAHPDLQLWRHLDERSAAFFALGIAKATRQPVALLSTSGTAAANFFPAVIEAKYARVPLVVLTADRPHELREVGAPQAIDQVHLFGRHVKAAFDLPLPEDSDGIRRVVRVTAVRAAALAAAVPGGPVHLNLPFREPLVPAGGEPAVASVLNQAFSCAGRAPEVVTGAPTLSEEQIGAIASWLQPGRRGIIVCGPQDDPALPKAASELARVLAFPILADPLSGLRCGEHDRTLIIDAYDVLLRIPEWVELMRPEMIIRFGAMPTSKAYRQYLEYGESKKERTMHLVVDPGGQWLDPTYLATHIIHADPVDFCRRLVHRLEAAAFDGERSEADVNTSGTGQPEIVSAWCRRWLVANRKARQVMEEEMARLAEPFEGAVFPLLNDILPSDATLFVGNSMPVRDLDAFFSGRDRALRILGNRGANGIDGLTSTALGAAAGTQRPVVLVIGDLSFYHDLNGLLAARQYALDLVVILIHNDGGGIFSFLPQATLEDSFEPLFGTPHGLDFAPVVAMYGGHYERIERLAHLRDAVRQALAAGGLHVLELRSDRSRNVALHRRIWQAVEHALAALL